MLTTVASYSLPYEAQIAWARLDSEGIPAYIAGVKAADTLMNHNQAFELTILMKEQTRC
jgi:hypothetical protein